VVTWTVKSDSFLEARIKAGETPCVLVVDDDPCVQTLERLVLEEHGYTVLVAGSGEEALDLFDNARPDLVLLDVELGGIDGFTTCQRIRQRSKVPILMVTCKDGTGDKIWGLEIGADDYLTKPFHPDELVARTKACLRRSTISESVAEPANNSERLGESSNSGICSQADNITEPDDILRQHSELEVTPEQPLETEVGVVCSGSVGLEINPGSVRQMLSFVAELRQDARFRLFRLVGNQSQGMDIRLGLREPLHLQNILLGMQVVSTVEQASSDLDGQEPRFVVELK